MKLLAHPDHLPATVSGVDVAADLWRGRSSLVYRMLGGGVAMPMPLAGGRADGLWQHTCFELFVQPADDVGYFEFNFSPSTQWAAYRFARYRDGMTDLPLMPPVIERLEDGVRVSVDLSELPTGPWRVAITAVIEEMDGTKSYWSLAHPAGKPDFHHPDCFVREVPAPERA